VKRKGKREKAETRDGGGASRRERRGKRLSASMRQPGEKKQQTRKIYFLADSIGLIEDARGRR